MSVVALYGFYATTTSSGPAMTPFTYDTVEIDPNHQLTTLPATSYVVPQTGYYWFFLTVVWDGSTFSEYDVGTFNDGPPAQVFRQHYTFNGYDCQSRDFIRQVNQGQISSASSVYPTWADTSTGSSVGAFQIDNIMSPVVSVCIHCMIMLVCVGCIN